MCNGPELLKTLKEDQPRISPVKFGQNPISGQEEMLFEEVVYEWTDGHTHRRTTDKM